MRFPQKGVLAEKIFDVFPPPPAGETQIKLRAHPQIAPKYYIKKNQDRS
jgi:hypothetical protein